MNDRTGEDGALDTVTHARLRAAQGDVQGARRILRGLLSARPDDAEAIAFLASLAAASGGPAEDETTEPLAPPVGTDAATLRERFRDMLGPESEGPDGRITRRLEELLRRIEDVRRTDHAG